MNVSRLLPVMIFLAAGALYSVRARKLTVPAALTGVLLALAVYSGAGFTGLAMMAVFFFAGTVATSWNMPWKRQQGLAENERGTRSPGQVFANAGMAAFAGLVTYIAPSGKEVLQMMIAASFAAATSDTLSSELGNVYGRHFYNILSFKRDRRGLDGVVSLEGSISGIAGSALIAGVWSFGTYANGPGFHFRPVLIIILSGVIGNAFDSILGATLERRHSIGNNTVNFLNTAMAATCAWLLNFL